MAVPDSTAFLCYACKLEFVPEKVVTPLRIFLSYGHDANEELVRAIKADLEMRGHDVWFDKSEIRFGDDWRRQITDRIIGSNRVLSFLSKYSTRDPGVCLDELAIAIGAKGGNIQTILVESETEVKPPLSIGHIQWLDMHDWKERRAAGEAAWQSWYHGKFGEIVRVIESVQSRRFAGEIRKLEENLEPISSDTRIAQLLKKPLGGRTWLFGAVDQWRNAADRASRLFWIMGAPGVGKSAFAAHLTHFGRDKVIAAQFVEYDKPDHRKADRIVRTLAFQIATRLPDYRKLLLTLPEITELDRKNPAELFDYLLANPLKLSIGGGRERYLIVIDALDEAGGSGRNELVEMLARNAPRLPDRIGIIVTSRPESDVVGPLQGLNPSVLDTTSDKNRDDIRDYLRSELALQLQVRADADRLVEQILEKSEGVFLYAERFCGDVQQGHLSLDRPEQFPQGLGVQGMGGIGKSVLAAALARDKEVRLFFPDGIVWISCGQNLSPGDRLKRLRDLVWHLGGDNTFQSLPQGQGVLRELLQAKAVLIVLDDVWHAADAQIFDFLGPRCRMLVTTRDAGILHALHGELMPVSLFSEREALQLLADVADVAPSALPAEALEIVRECCCLLLALAICGGMVKVGKSWQDILRRLREADQKLVENTTVSRTTLENSLDAVLAGFSPLEQTRLAELCMALKDGVISEGVVHELWSKTGNLSAEACHALLIKFQSFALVRIQGQGQESRITVHQLVLDLLRHLNPAQ